MKNLSVFATNLVVKANNGGLGGRLPLLFTNITPLLGLFKEDISFILLKSQKISDKFTFVAINSALLYKF